MPHMRYVCASHSLDLAIRDGLRMRRLSSMVVLLIVIALSWLIVVDQASGKVFFTGTKDDPLAHQVYALELGSPGKVTRLTDTGFHNSASMDKSGKSLLISRSSVNRPPQVYLADQSGKRIAWVEENKLDAKHPYAPYLASHRPVEFGTIKAAKWASACCARSGYRQLRFSVSSTLVLRAKSSFPCLKRRSFVSVVFGKPGAGSSLPPGWPGWRSGLDLLVRSA